MLNHVDDGSVRHWIRLPSPDLEWVIEHYWSASWDLRGGQPFTQETIPHPAVHFVLEENNSMIFGVVKKRWTRALEGKGRVFGLKFKPGCFYPFLKSPLSGLTNRTIPPGNVFGRPGELLEDAILSLNDEGEMVSVAEQFLRERMPERDETAVLVSTIADRIRNDREIVSVEEITKRFGITLRNMQRLFDRYVGVSPKWVIRVYRLHELVERLDTGEPMNLAHLSQDLGYFDQSHFVRDFKSIAGRTPTEHQRQFRLGSASE